MRGALLAVCCAVTLVVPAAAWAQVSYFQCAMQVTFRKPYVHDTVWEHQENRYAKSFKIDSAAHMIYVYRDRQDEYVPICSTRNAACVVEWQEGAIRIDGTAAPDDPFPPHLDFRRSFAMAAHGSEAHLVIADYGESRNGRANMSWSYDGPCHSTDQPAQPMRPPGAGPGKDPATNMPPPRNPLYEQPTTGAMAIPAAEAARVLAHYTGNTMTGYSGGGHWFHMWFFDKALAYTSDDMDISGEAKPRQWYLGKDASGYRICPKPIPAGGERGCYPLLIKRIGDSWVEHDMDGNAYFTLLPGRQ